jgi:hypothetical protein
MKATRANECNRRRVERMRVRNWLHPQPNPWPGPYPVWIDEAHDVDMSKLVSRILNKRIKWKRCEILSTPCQPSPLMDWLRMNFGRYATRELRKMGYDK